jgi:signal transduction histidine kinase
MYVNTQPPQVVIEELALDNKRVAPSEALDIQPGENNLEIHYTGLSFVNPDYMRFKYKLEGLDADWNDVGNRRTAYYSHLPPGHYTFTVIAANSDGVWNDTGASLRVVIHPPFWRTWWFISATVAALFVVTLLAYRRRIANLKRLHTVQRAFSNQLIESQESERKRIAAELHDSLSQSLSIIRSRASLCLNRLDDPKRTRDQLNEIDSAAAYALEEVREIAHNLRPVELDRLGLTEAIQAMAQKVTDSTPIRLAVELDPIDGVLSNEAEINLYRIVQESLNNIVKHSKASEAEVAIKRKNGTMQITIHDNGRGFVPGVTATSHANGSGFGLVNIAERANLLGGKQIIHSVPGQGTTITINVALKDGIDGQRNPHLAG